jgi:hypothetical protein
MSEFQLSYPVAEPRMDKSIPAGKVKLGTFSHLAGVDGRFAGCLRKFYGMKKLTSLSEAVIGTVTITGTLSPDCTGNYYVNGSYGGYAKYTRADEAYELWQTSATQYVISTAAGDPSVHSWVKNSAGITGSYAAWLSATGTATVATSATSPQEIGDYGGISFIKEVTFRKPETSDIYRGFVVRWDSIDSLTDQRVDLFYTLDDGDTWLVHEIWDTGNSITASAEMDCSSHNQYLFVCVKGKAPKTVYYDGLELVTVDMGPGDWVAELAYPTEVGSPVVADGYNLAGDGVYQVAWRFYSSTRGIYSALSAPLTIRLGLFKTTYATATITFNTAGGDSGKMVEGDIFTINGRTYEYISAGSDVTIPLASLATTEGHCIALADAINGDSSAEVSAVAGLTTVQLTAKDSGADGNALTLVVTEVAPNQDDITVSGATLTGGGEPTTTAEPTCKATIALPDNDDVLADHDYDDFDAMFDTIDIFRTINLGSGVQTQQGAIFYLEQSVAKTGNWDDSSEWDALTVDIGSIMDDALPFYDSYDPEKDIVSELPTSGTVERYQNITFLQDGYDTVFSGLGIASAEYFSTYNRRFGDDKEGEPLRFMVAGDVMFILSPSAIIHIYKAMEGQPLRFTRLHLQRGLIGKGAAHSVGNSVIMLTAMGLVLLDASNGSMGQISALDRLLFLDWAEDLADVQSGYDSLMNASFFLNPARSEMAIVWHSTQVCTLLEGANFVSVTSGPDIEGGGRIRAYFVTEGGIIVSPDYDKSGSGTMWDLDDSYTLNGTATAIGDTLTDTDATFHADMVGTLCYMASGDNAGECREIASVDVENHILTFASNFTSQIAVGDTYAINPVPFKMRLPALQVEGVSEFARWKMSSVAVKAGELDGFTDNPNDFWRCSAYRDGAEELSAEASEVDMVANSSKAIKPLRIDGVEVTPYIEQLASGVDFEVDCVEIGCGYTGSKKVSDNS